MNPVPVGPTEIDAFAVIGYIDTPCTPHSVGYDAFNPGMIP
jgi:hypothetical protein